MSKVRFTLNILAVMIFTLTVSSLAHGQATRTWVSGVGDDVNPCSRTAPCKTYAGAISKTARDGEISTLDPGGFGAVTITKSITINGTEGQGHGSILATLGTNGVNINITDAADARKIVRLKNLDIFGAGSGLNGVRITAANRVYIEDCSIDGFTNNGISDVRAVASVHLLVANTVITNSTQSNVTIVPGVGGSVIGMFNNVRLQGSRSNSGYAQSGNVKTTIRDSFITGNFSNGVFADGAAGELNLVSNVVSHNATGISVTTPSIVRLAGGTTLTNNTTASINAGGVAQVQSDGTNVISGNGANNLPTGVDISLN